ncbi:MAG: hypothetical protein Q4A28_04135 [Brachymonas sp.]|nr:hypothetical protein [Brachymonas sp.]
MAWRFFIRQFSVFQTRLRQPFIGTGQALSSGRAKKAPQSAEDFLLASFYRCTGQFISEQMRSVHPHHLVRPRILKTIKRTKTIHFLFVQMHEKALIRLFGNIRPEFESAASLSGALDDQAFDDFAAGEHGSSRKMRCGCKLVESSNMRLTDASWDE